jgi:hypothetical protein
MNIKTASIILIVILSGVGVFYFSQNNVDTASIKNETNKPGESIPTQAQDIQIIAPNGGEVLNGSSPVTISYTLSDAFFASLDLNAVIEIYLLDKNNLLVGYIGDRDLTTGALIRPRVKSGSYTWNLEKTLRNAGLDMLPLSILSGEYRLLVLAKIPTQPQCEGCDFPIDTLDGPYSKYENGKIRFTNTKNTISLIASDTSDGFFMIKTNTTLPPDKG